MAADLPGSRKATGLRSHTSTQFMCAVCNKRFPSLVDHRCYDHETFKYREDARYIKYAFRARAKDAAEREKISERRGIRWSALDLLPDWFPSRDGPPDFMHAAYLGEAKHVIQGILIAGGMFTKRNKKHKPLERLEEFFDNLWWPGSAGRVPAGLITGGAGKADEWRNTCAVLPVALYAAWQVDGEIPDADSPKLNPKEKAGINQQRIEDLLKARRHENAAHMGELTEDYATSIDKTRMRRNYRDHFDTILEWLVALRIFGSRSISVREAQRAENCHSWACQAWTRLNCHLTPYFHLLSHLAIWIYRLGPVYGWWTYPYERFNGFLSRVQHNGHPGELEATMMRAWVRLHLIYDLILHLQNLGDAKTPEDEASIEDLRACLQGRNKGNEHAIHFPKHATKVNLKREGLYAIVFTYLRRAWQEKVHLIPDTSGREVAGSAFIGRTVGTQ
ncbi:hypothetical protein TRAPUB_11902 [Trametes pubescens]|uniref:Uncharacterized protein n=1 Tax=Trametes pubescens TaxID=154538 RepID=A0A1M2VVG7_TRAPU|nr:hypothetical protein TRAPUB_11902 [Trametes pubescens]